MARTLVGLALAAIAAVRRHGPAFVVGAVLCALAVWIGFGLLFPKGLGLLAIPD